MLTHRPTCRDRIPSTRLPWCPTRRRSTPCRSVSTRRLDLCCEPQSLRSMIPRGNHVLQRNNSDGRHSRCAPQFSSARVRSTRRRASVVHSLASPLSSSSSSNNRRRWVLVRPHTLNKEGITSCRVIPVYPNAISAGLFFLFPMISLSLSLSLSPSLSQFSSISI